ncbi:MAG: SMP-30/gluconolactonase/LRE family protein [Candidatus Brocadiia bacterium]
MASEPGIETLDEAFSQVADAGAAPRPIAQGLEFTEGPAWLDEEQMLLFSDIPADTIYRWQAGAGHTVWRRPSRHANGNTLDLEGRLVTCEHGSRTVTRTERDGTVVTLAASYQGKRLNSPNDAVVRSDGSIWFTDPPYGISAEAQEQPASHVFRLDPGAEEPVAVIGDMTRPNGLCFSPDESLLYVANSDRAAHRIRRFRVRPDGSVGGGEVFAVIEPGAPDGIRCDAAGRLLSTAGDGVHVFDPQGRLLGKVRTPQTAANCTFGGPGGTTLFITATTTVWAVELRVRGAR